MNELYLGRFGALVQLGCGGRNGLLSHKAIGRKGTWVFPLSANLAFWSISCRRIRNSTLCSGRIETGKNKVTEVNKFINQQ
jgi:hypothetical protein